MRKKAKIEGDEVAISTYRHMVQCGNCGARYIGEFPRGMTIQLALKCDPDDTACPTCGVGTEWRKTYRHLYEDSRNRLTIHFGLEKDVSGR